MIMVKIAIIDDQGLFRESLANLIRGEAGLSCMMLCDSATQFLLAIQKGGAVLPDILLLDLEMPGMNGIELNGILQKQYPAIKIIILSVHANEKLIASLIREGADGYLTKNCEKKELIGAIHMVNEQGFYINKMTMQAMQQHARQVSGPLHNVNGIPLDLTKREVEILKLICQEYSSGEIAEKLFLSPRTVEGHRNNLVQKIGCKNIAGLVFAIRHHIYSIGF
jgi:DNA-binding NarL/FixJ family response regulator